MNNYLFYYRTKQKRYQSHPWFTAVCMLWQGVGHFEKSPLVVTAACLCVYISSYTLSKLGGPLPVIRIHDDCWEFFVYVSAYRSHRETRNSHLAIIAWCFPFLRGVLTPISTKTSYLTSLFPGLLSPPYTFITVLFLSCSSFILFAIKNCEVKKVI